jgi:aspartate aminotransferase-like enzyme
MFGPNAMTKFGVENYSHHRSTHFRELMMVLTHEFATKFDLPNDATVLFITGSGSLVNEIVIASVEGPFYVYGGGATFGDRLFACADKHDKAINVDLLEVHSLSCRYETSVSRAQQFGYKRGLRVVDMVSAFPYYMPEETTDIWTTVSGKALGGYPGIGIIVIRGRAWEHIKPPIESYLSLRSHAKAWPEPLYTPAMPLLYDLAAKIENFDRKEFVARIDRRRAWLEDVVPSENIVGEGPVFTISELDETFANKWGLYKALGGWQLFLWSGTDEQYKAFCGDLRGTAQ